MYNKLQFFFLFSVLCTTVGCDTLLFCCFFFSILAAFCCYIGYLFLEKELKDGWEKGGERILKNLGEGKNMIKVYLNLKNT